MILQDTTIVTPVITSGSALIAYLITIVAGVLGGYLNNLYATGKVILSAADHTIQLVIGAIAGFGLLRLGILLGISIPTDVMGLNATAFATIVAALLAKGVTAISPKPVA
jgi:hypothetical protein